MRTSPRPFLVGLLLGFSVLVEYPALLAVAPICLYAVLFLRPWRRLVWIVAGGALCAVLLMSYHWAAFGSPFSLPYDFSTQRFRSLGFFMGLGTPNWPAFSNTLFTPYRGLFFSAPWLLLAVPGAVVLLLRRFRAEVAVCSSIFLLFVWMTASLQESWHGGWTLGARYMIPAIPFLVVLAAGLCVDPRHKGRSPVWLRRSAWAAAILAVIYSGVLMLAGTAVKPEVPQHIKRPFGEYILPKFYAGELSISTQSIDRAEAPPAGPRFASNLGQRVGLVGLWSLMPLGMLYLLALAWLKRQTRIWARVDRPPTLRER